MKKSNGLILYQGPSTLDGAPIVVIAVGLTNASANSKTGAMLQTYILRADMRPTDAIKIGADASICGDCVHRGDGTGKGRTCYVNVGQGPLVVWKTFTRGGYPHASSASEIIDAGRSRTVRLGSYGDPAAVPAHVWQALTSHAKAHTGYTHQWRTAGALRGLCMASADSVTEASEAQAQGWRTFRVALPSHVTRTSVEVVCPASVEGGRKLLCEQCKACSGAQSGRKGSIVIQAHGGFAVIANVQRMDAVLQVAA